MRVAVTGGSGFIGRRLVAALHRRGNEVRVLSRHERASFPEGVRSVRGDLTSADVSLAPLLEGCEVLFHCAGEVRERTAMRALHVDGTQRLLHAARAQARRMAKEIRWIQLSSVGAYGPARPANAPRIVTEESPLSPVGEYETTKTLSDRLVIEASEPGILSSTIVRPSNVFGASMTNNSLRQLGVMVRKGLFFYIGAPGAIATYVHVDDVVAALLTCAQDERARNQTYNVSNDCPLEDLIQGMAVAQSVRAPRLRVPEGLVRAIVRAMGSVVSLPLTKERIDALVLRTNYPYTKLHRELGFAPAVPVPASIGEVMEQSS